MSDTIINYNDRFNCHNEIITTCSYHSPCGMLILGEYEDALCLCDWADSRRHAANTQRLMRRLKTKMQLGGSDLLEKACHELDDYFSGGRRSFDIPLGLVGTDFEQRIWRELASIAYGQTISYAHLAQRVGCTNGVRAVANAVGANAMSIFLPCHRVIGSDGTLRGYAGGLPAKTYLLDMELGASK